MSDIRLLYDTLAATDIVYTNEASSQITVSAHDLDTVKEEIESLHLPTRVLIPLQSRGAGEGSGMELLTVGTSNIFGRITWRIADLFLHASAGEGYGLHSHLPDLVRYAGAYAEKIADAGADLGIGTMTFAGLDIQVSMIEWPLQSDQLYYGVEALISYEEILNP